MKKSEIAKYFDTTPQTLCNWIKGSDGKIELHRAAMHWIVAREVNFRQVVLDIDTISLLNDMGGENESVKKRLNALRAIIATMI